MGLTLMLRTNEPKALFKGPGFVTAYTTSCSLADFSKEDSIIVGRLELRTSMAAFYSQHLLPEALTSQYSVLHQERLYLLNALAEEANQGESLTHTLISLQAQIHQSETSNPPESTRKLRQQVKAVRNKIGTCQHRERALAANLANVVAQMEGYKRYQWRSAEEQYAMQLQAAQQHAQSVLRMMSPSRPAFALRSPANIDLAAQMQYMTLGPAAGPAYDNRASLDPYMGSLNQPLMSMNVPYGYAEAVTGPFQTGGSPMSQDVTSWSGYTDVSSTVNVATPESAMETSFPCVSPTSLEWTNVRPDESCRQRSASMLETVQEYPIATNTALRRLSLLDGGAALKLERQAAEERARIWSMGGGM